MVGSACTGRNPLTRCIDRLKLLVIALGILVVVVAACTVVLGTAVHAVRSRVYIAQAQTLTPLTNGEFSPGTRHSTPRRRRRRADKPQTMTARREGSARCPVRIRRCNDGLSACALWYTQAISGHRQRMPYIERRQGCNYGGSTDTKCIYGVHTSVGLGRSPRGSGQPCA